MTSTAAAQDGTTSAQATAKTKDLSAVIVTGTRASDRNENSSLTPIDVVSAMVLQQTGINDLPTALACIIPSLNFPRASAADTADTQRPAQLRDLSPDQVLVLVNGKRWRPGAILLDNGVIGRGLQSVDLNTIPLSRSITSKCWAMARLRRPCWPTSAPRAWWPSAVRSRAC